MKFTVNGKSYNSLPLSFGTIRDLDKMNVSLGDILMKPLVSSSAYFALCSGLLPMAADVEIEQHIMNGGSINDITDVMVKEANESGFFQALVKKAEQTISDSLPKAKTKQKSTKKSENISE